MSSTIIPAHPGFFALHIDTSECTADMLPWIDATPIIAWHVDAETDGEVYTSPVTPGGSGPVKFIKYPDGKVFDLVSEATFSDGYSAARHVLEQELAERAKGLA